jgi:tetratricopeptide (TPR) repeat protein
MPEAELSQEELTALRRAAERVRRAAQQAFELANANAAASTGLLAAGKIWELGNQPRRATELYERAVRLNREDFEAMARLALVEVKTGRAQDGLRTASELASNAPEFRFRTLTGSLTITAMTVLGDALRATGSRDAAIEAYQSALRLEPDDQYSAGRLAELFLDQGRTDEAVTLEPMVNATYSPGLKAALRLAGNEVEFLPALTRVRIDAIAADAVAA